MTYDNLGLNSQLRASKGISGRVREFPWDPNWQVPTASFYSDFLRAGGVLALNLAQGQNPNLVPNEYSDFERFANGDNVGGNVANGSAKCFDGTSAPSGNKCLKMEASANDNYVYMGTAIGDYNIPVIASKHYLVSGYVMSPTASAGYSVFTRRNSDGAFTNVTVSPPGRYVPTLVANTWERFYFKYINDTSTSIILRVDNDISGNDMYWDGLMVEEVDPDVEVPQPSAYHPPALSSFSASNITAGTMSAELITGGTMSADYITGGTMSADYITGGTMSADYITGGTMSADYITGGTMSANYITGGTMSASYLTGGIVDTGLLGAGTIEVAVGVGTADTGHIRLDGANKRIIINDGTNDRVLIGFDSGGF